MNNTLVLRIATLSLLLAFGSAADSAVAQDKAAPKVETRTLLENAKVLVTEIHFQPGAENDQVPTHARVVRALTDGALERHYADGRKEVVEWKAGQVRFNEATPANTAQYTTRNVGKKELVLYVVVLK